MRHRKKQTKLGRSRRQRQALFKQLAASLIIHERLTTTLAKAKILVGLMNKLVTTAKEGTLASRRRLLAFLGLKPAAHKLVDEIAGRTKGRSGGFTRLVRLGQRRGDNAMMAQVELVDKVQPTKEEKK